MSDNFLLVATLCAMHYLLQHAIQLASCFIACYLPQHAAHAAIRHCMLCKFATQSSIIWGKLGAVNCLITGSTSNHNGLSDKVHCHKM